MGYSWVFIAPHPHCVTDGFFFIAKKLGPSLEDAKVRVLRLNGEPMEFHLPLDAKISDLPLGSGMAHLP